jgi:hypothetical protein
LLDELVFLKAARTLRAVTRRRKLMKRKSPSALQMTEGIVLTRPVVAPASNRHKGWMTLPDRDLTKKSSADLRARASTLFFRYMREYIG